MFHSKIKKQLNERWDTRNHSFYKQVPSCDFYQTYNIVSNDYQIHQGK